MLLNTKLMHDGGHECGCGHHHEEGHECGCGHHHEEGHECGRGHHHEDGHECGCGHCHEEPAPLSDDEKVAILAYMIRHNGQHLEELYVLGQQLDGDAKDLVSQAVDRMAESNETLVKAFYALQDTLEPEDK